MPRTRVIPRADAMWIADPGTQERREREVSDLMAPPAGAALGT
jgi:hypothetical protein